MNIENLSKRPIIINITDIRNELRILIEERESAIYQNEFNPYIEKERDELDELIKNCKKEIEYLEKNKNL